MSDVTVAEETVKVPKAKKTDPSLLSFERSLYPTDALFYSLGADGARTPVPLVNKTTLGTQSQYQQDASNVPASGNPQRVEAAFLPVDSKDLLIEFNLSVSGSSLRPQSCDVPAFRDQLVKFCQAYAEADGFRTIGRRIAANIANGRWAWKNRLLATSFTVKVEVLHPVAKTFEFDAFGLALSHFDWIEENEAVRELGEIIASSLSGKGISRFRISGILDLGPMTPVFPSQEFVDKDDNDKMAPGKVLYYVPIKGERCAAFHEQKIGAALRTLDTWHEGYVEDGVGHIQPGTPLAVNPYGQSREVTVVVRQGTKLSGNASLYEIMKRDLAAAATSIATNGPTDDEHFMIANLIRGGVFGMKDKPPKAAKEKAAKATDNTEGDEA